MAKLIDCNGRVGVITEDRKGNSQGLAACLFARPENVPYIIDDIEGITGVANARIITATAWTLQPDGSYRGEWYDEMDNFHSAKVVIERLTCKRCGHAWIPQQLVAPKNCPKCNSPYWDKPKK